MIISLSFLIGLLIGSGLNKLVYWLPNFLSRQWQTEILPADPQNLFFNCACCRYCLQVLTGLLVAFVIYRYGITWQTVAILIFSFCLLTLAFIDLKTYLLPDIMTLPLLWLGLLCNLWGFFTDIDNAVLGAMIGYMSLWSIAKLFVMLTGKIGMANGDFKLLAAIGAWLGWQSLVDVILVASVMGTVISLISIFLKVQLRENPIPFGPYLAFAGWLMLIVFF